MPLYVTHATEGILSGVGELKVSKKIRCQTFQRT